MTPRECNYRLAELVRAAQRRIALNRWFPRDNQWRVLMELVPGGLWRD